MARPKKQGRSAQPKPLRSVIDKHGRVKQRPVEALQRLGRITLTPEISRLFCKLLTMGTTFQAAAEQCGVGLRTANQWLTRGRDVLERVDVAGGELPSGECLDAQEVAYAQFVLDVEAAYGEVETVASKRVLFARDWRAQAWWLERRRPETYGSRNEIRIGAVPAAELSNEQLMGELRELGFRPVQIGAGSGPAAGTEMAAGAPSHGASSGTNGHGGGNGHGGNGHAA